MLNRQNQRPPAVLRGNSECTCWTWIEQHSSPGSRRREEDRVSLHSVLCFPTRICQRNESKPETKQLRMRTRRGGGEPAPNLFVLFCFWCLHVLPELVNHIGRLGYHSILTKWGYLLNFICSQNCWGVLVDWVFFLLSFFSYRGRVEWGVNTSILSTYIIERMYVFSSFHGLKHFSHKCKTKKHPSFPFFHIISIFHVL